MSISALARKLGIKPENRVLIMHPPQGYKTLLEPLPKGATIMLSGTGQFDVVQCFVTSRASVESSAPTAIGSLRPGGLLWLCYPKKSSHIKADISRDEGWESVRAAGWEGVSLIAIDETWSAMRFRPSSEIKPRRG